MALTKIPGAKGKYMADDRGLRSLGMSTALGNIALKAAQRGANLGKQYDPKGEYVAERRDVMGGYPNTRSLRAGAAVVQVKPGDGNAIRRMVMVDVLMGMESGRG